MGWTIDVQPASAQNLAAPSATHDDDDSVVLDSDEAYEQHYGVRDPMLDLLRKSYLHGWTLKGAHARFVTYAQHTAKCKHATIPPWPKSTFHRWLKTEKENYEKSPDKDEQLPQQRRPIRHESHVQGLLRHLIENGFKLHLVGQPTQKMNRS